MPTPTILVVDDESIVRSVCSQILVKNGFHAIQAENGEEGLNIYLERHPEIALILADVSMPVMDGIEMAGRIFAFQPHSNIILMTGFNAHSIVPEDLRKVCAIIQKPFTPNSLLAEIRKCLKYEEEQLQKQPV